MARESEGLPIAIQLNACLANLRETVEHLTHALHGRSDSITMEHLSQRITKIADCQDRCLAEIQRQDETIQNARTAYAKLRHDVDQIKGRGTSRDASQAKQ